MVYKFKSLEQRLVFGTASGIVLVIIYVALQWATHFNSMPFSKAIIVIIVGVCTIVFIQEQIAALLKIKK